MSRFRRHRVIPLPVVDAVDVVADAVPAAADGERPLFRVFPCLFPRRDISRWIHALFRQIAASSYRLVALVVEVVADSVVVAAELAVPRRSSDLATTPWR